MADEAKKKADAGGGGHGERAGDKKDAGGSAAAATSKGGIGALLSKTPVLLGGVMILEAGVLLMGVKMFGGAGPRSAAGADLVLEHAPKAEDGHSGGADSGHGGGHDNSAASPATKVDKKKAVEVQVLDFRAPNKQSGRTFLYDVTIFAVTKAEHEKHVKDTIAGREALIKDRVRTIIAQSDPEKLGGGSEPGLETLRRQVKYQLDEIVGEGIIDEVLVPRCIPFRSDF
jgi:flagellar basal body-associated protein FliL